MPKVCSLTKNLVAERFGAASRLFTRVVEHKENFRMHWEVRVELCGRVFPIDKGTDLLSALSSLNGGLKSDKDRLPSARPLLVSV